MAATNAARNGHRFVPLTADGVTVDTLYRCATTAQRKLRSWLHQRIWEIEGEVSEAQALHLLD